MGKQQLTSSKSNELFKDFQDRNGILRVGTSGWMRWIALVIAVAIFVFSLACLIFIFILKRRIENAAKTGKENLDKLQGHLEAMKEEQKDALKKIKDDAKDIIKKEIVSVLEKKIEEETKKNCDEIRIWMDENIINQNLSDIKDRTKDTIKNINEIVVKLKKGELPAWSACTEDINKKIEELAENTKNLENGMKKERQAAEQARLTAEQESKKANELNAQCQQQQKELEQQTNNLQQTIDIQVAERSKELEEKLAKSNQQFNERLEQAVAKRLADMLNGKLEQDLKRYRTQEDELKKQVDNLRNDISKAKEQLTSEKALKEEALRQEHEYNEENRLLNSKLEKHCSQLERQGKELSDTQNALATATSERDGLKEQLVQRDQTIANHAAEVDSLNQRHAEELQRREQEMETARQEREAQWEEKLALAESVVLPCGLQDLPEFAPLRVQLLEWLRQQPETAEIIRSSLGQFARRQLLDQDTLDLSLRNLSVGLSETMRALGRSPVEALDVLVTWRDFLQKCAEGSDISLQLPNLNDSVDSSWMTPRKASVRKVSWIVSWAVSNRKYGVRHNAVVE